MNRRNFFRLLTGAVVAPALAPLAKLLPPPPNCTYVEGVNACVGEFADYLTVSDLAFESAIDPVVEAAQVYYSTSLMANLKANCPPLRDMKMFQSVPLPENTGKTIQFVNYSLDKSEEV